MTETLRVSQRQINWLHEFGLPGTDAALETLKQKGEIVIIDGQEKENGSKI
jgi:hypothetical protein